MRLLVSVRDADEANVAVEAGADIVDAKEPALGVLGPVGAETLRAIARAVAGRRPISAALGDFHEDSSGAAIAEAARAAARSSVGIVKAGLNHASRDTLMTDCVFLVGVLQSAMAPGATCDVVLGTYADVPASGEGYLHSLIDAAVCAQTAGERCRIAGVLLDTLCKDGRALFDIMPVERIALWVESAHDAELFVALAGSLRADHVEMARDTGADIMGVRTAACDGGRTGRVSASRVRRLVRAIHVGALQGTVANRTEIG